MNPFSSCVCLMALMVHLFQYLQRRDLDRWSAGRDCRSWCHGALGLRLSLNMCQGLLRNHEQLPTLTANQNHACKRSTWHILRCQWLGFFWSKSWPSKICSTSTKIRMHVSLCTDDTIFMPALDQNEFQIGQLTSWPFKTSQQARGWEKLFLCSLNMVVL